ncbi:MAG TPA: BLUF domain-containing protein [Verrucomicrobiae bacterium]|nr:BLUF domain-containing protein [Verrucomicrobiae bacterium]
MEKLFQIVYTSTASVPLSREELRELLKGSHERNARAGITGLLLYKDGNFMQALEGGEIAVKNLFTKICDDRRHHGILTLIEGPIEHRQFPDSSMAFRDLNHEASRDIAGYSEFLNTPLNGDLLRKDLSRCERLLLLFKKNIR